MERQHPLLYPRRGRLLSRRNVLAVAGSALLAGCAAPSPRFDFVRVASVGPLTGPRAAVGQDVADGVRLAVEEANVLARPGALPVEGQSIDEADAARLARAAADGRLVLAIASAAPNAAVLEPLRRTAAAPALIGLESNAEATVEPGTLALAPSAALVAETTAAALAFNFGSSDIAVVVSGTSTAIEQARLFLDIAPARGLTVRSTQYLRSIETNHAALVNPVRAGAPRAVIVFGHGYDAGALWAELRPRDARIPLMLGAGALDEGFQRSAGGFFEGVLALATTPQPREVPSALRFAEAFTARFGRPPSVTAARAHDAAQLGLRTIEQASRGSQRPGRVAVKAALAAMETFDGPFRSYRLSRGLTAAWPLALYRLERDGTPLLIGQPESNARQ